MPSAWNHGMGPRYVSLKGLVTQCSEHIQVTKSDNVYISFPFPLLMRHTTCLKTLKCLSRRCLKLLPQCNLLLCISFMARLPFILAPFSSSHPNTPLLSKPKLSPYHLILDSLPFLLPSVISCFGPQPVHTMDCKPISVSMGHCVYIVLTLFHPCISLLVICTIKSPEQWKYIISLS